MKSDEIIMKFSTHLQMSDVVKDVIAQGANPVSYVCLDENGYWK